MLIGPASLTVVNFTFGIRVLFLDHTVTDSQQTYAVLFAVVAVISWLVVGVIKGMDTPIK